MSTPKLTSTRLQGKDLCDRICEQPLVVPSDVAPSDPALKVIGVLNPTFTYLNGKPILVVRVDERPLIPTTVDGRAIDGTKTLRVAYFVGKDATRLGTIQVKVPATYDADIESILPESARQLSRPDTDPELLLCFVSHLRVAEIHNNGISVSQVPLVFPSDQFSQFGCEDPRATILEGVPCVAFNGIGRFGATAWFVSLSDAGVIKEKRMMFGPDHKHCALFPERVAGKFQILTRPLTRSSISREGIWLQSSLDLVNWGDPWPLLHPRPTMWDSIRVGPGPSPVILPTGWLLLYYGVDSEHSYHLGAALLDRSDPRKIIARSDIPILSPMLPWERNGRRADTIFPCGVQLLPGNETLRIYYGAADEYIGAADVSIPSLNHALSPTR